MTSSCILISKDFLTNGKKIKEIGAGSYGKIFLYEYQGKEFAVKEMKFTLHDENYYGITQEMILDADTLIKFKDFQYIVRIDGICFDNNKIYLILEKMDNDLRHLSKKLSFSERLENFDLLMKSMVTGLAMLEKVGINHYDIKPKNILYKIIDKKYEFKITDFGISRAIISGISPEPNAVITILYRPPELLAAEILFKNSPVQGREDIWSLGIMMLEWITGGKILLDLGERVHLRLKRYGLEFFDDWNKYKNNFNEFVKNIYDGTITGSFNSRKYLKNELSLIDYQKIPDRIFKILDVMLKWNYRDRWSANQILESLLEEEINPIFIKALIPPIYKRIVHEDSIKKIIEVCEELFEEPAVILTAIELLTRYLGIVGHVPVNIMLISLGCIMISLNYINIFIPSLKNVKEKYKKYRFSNNDILEIEKKILITIMFYVYNISLNETYNLLMTPTVIREDKELGEKDFDNILYNKNNYQLIKQIKISDFSKPVTEWIHK